MTTYYEKLKDPRWQKLRLEILESAGWECESCGSDTKTLHVHHRYYVPRKEPWDYTREQLLVLCEMCHEDVTAKTRELQQIVGENEGILDAVLGYARSVAVMDNPAVDSECSIEVENYEIAHGIADSVHAVAEAVISHCDEHSIQLGVIRELSESANARRRKLCKEGQFYANSK
jgi:hypothetical protein